MIISLDKLTQNYLIKKSLFNQKHKTKIIFKIKMLIINFTFNNKKPLNSLKSLLIKQNLRLTPII